MTGVQTCALTSGLGTWPLNRRVCSYRGNKNGPRELKVFENGNPRELNVFENGTLGIWNNLKSGPQGAEKIWKVSFIFNQNWVKCWSNTTLRSTQNPVGLITWSAQNRKYSLCVNSPVIFAQNYCTDMLRGHCVLALQRFAYQLLSRCVYISGDVLCVSFKLPFKISWCALSDPR